MYVFVADSQTLIPNLDIHSRTVERILLCSTVRDSEQCRLCAFHLPRCSVFRRNFLFPHGIARNSGGLLLLFDWFVLSLSGEYTTHDATTRTSSPPTQYCSWTTSFTEPVIFLFTCLICVLDCWGNDHLYFNDIAVLHCRNRYRRRSVRHVHDQSRIFLARGSNSGMVDLGTLYVDSRFPNFSIATRPRTHIISRYGNAQIFIRGIHGERVYGARVSLP